MKRNKRLFCLLLVALCLCMAAVPVQAARPCSLTVVCEEGGIPLVGAEFQIYLVATQSTDGTLVVTEDFAVYHVNISNDTTDWPQLASTLSAYVAYDAISPVRYGFTDRNGRLAFNGLSDGIYLVVGELHRQDDKFYAFDPTLVALPGTDAITGQPLWDVEMEPKAEWIPDVGGDDFTELKVLKVWEDANGENRPRSVTVHLLQDGVVIDTVELKEDDRWRHVWTDLPEGHQYTVVEEPVPGYTVTITRQGITYVVTNSRKGHTPPPPDKPWDPGDPDDPEDPETFLPETGQPWAWVLLLTAAGLGLLVIGLYLRRRDQHAA